MISCYHGGAAGLLSGECEASGERNWHLGAIDWEWKHRSCRPASLSSPSLVITCQLGITIRINIRLTAARTLNSFSTWTSLILSSAPMASLSSCSGNYLNSGIGIIFSESRSPKSTPVIAYHTLKDSISSVSIRFQKSSLSKRRVTAFIHCKLSSWK